MDRYQFASVVVICISVLESFALMKGIDGAILSMVLSSMIGVVTGLIGYKHGEKVGWRKAIKTLAKGGGRNGN